MRTRIVVGVMMMMLMGVLPAAAATISGVVTDTSGAAMPGTRVVLRDVATRQETVVETGPDGRFSIEAPATGTYLMSVTREGFSEAAQTVVIDSSSSRWMCRCRSRSARWPPRWWSPPLVRSATRSRFRCTWTPSRERGGADQPDLDRRRADDGREHHAGGERPVRCAAAPARARLDAAAGARRRRAAQHRAPGDGSHRRGGRPGVARCDQPHGGGQRRRHADVRLGRTGRHHQHHHQRGVVHARSGSSSTASTASTAPTRTACAAPAPSV